MAGFSRPACAYPNQPATAAASAEDTAATVAGHPFPLHFLLRGPRRHVPFLSHGWLVGHRLRRLLALDMHRLDVGRGVIREADEERFTEEVVNREAHRVIDPRRNGNLTEPELAPNP